MPFYVKALDPQLTALGPQQQFVWGTHSTADWQWINRTIPTDTAPVNTHVDWMNVNQKGYCIGHLTTPTNAFGMWHFSQVTWQPNQENSVLMSTRIWTFNEDGWEGFHFYKPAKFDGGLKAGPPTADDDVATKLYVDTHTGSIQGTADQIKVTSANGTVTIGFADEIKFSGGTLIIPTDTGSTEMALGMIRIKPVGNVDKSVDKPVENSYNKVSSLRKK